MIKLKIAYKLLKIRKDNSIGSLYINRKKRIPIGTWLEAECHPTKGYAVRPGWHVLATPEAPHLKMKDRAWFLVMIEDYYEFKRPASQGGIWYIANRMKILEKVDKEKIN